MPNAKGVPEEQIHIAVSKYGVCKVNIDTDLRLALTAKIREVFATKPAEFDPRNYLGPGREAIVGHGQTQTARAQLRGQGGSGDQAVGETGQPAAGLLHQGRSCLTFAPFKKFMNWGIEEAIPNFSIPRFAIPELLDGFTNVRLDCPCGWQ